MKINKLLALVLLLAGGALQAETYYYKKDSNGKLIKVDNPAIFCFSMSPSKDYYGCKDVCGYIACPHQLNQGE